MNDNDSLNQVITLKDGRKLGYAIFGTNTGKSVFYFHGHGSSRLEPKMYNLDEIKNKIQLIAVDRPGFGLSDFTEQHSILSWPVDVIELADKLKIDKFSILGGSGGAPFALACAYKIPKRLISCGIVSGLGPIEYGLEGMDKKKRMELEMAQKRPKLLRFIYKRLLKFTERLNNKSIEDLLKTFRKKSKDLPEPDRLIMEDKDQIPLSVQLMTDALRKGINGPYHEALLFAKPWGFSLKEISSEVKVFLWHGDLDTSVPKKMAEKVCEDIPNCEGKFYKDSAHLSAAVNHIEEILIKLIS